MIPMASNCPSKYVYMLSNLHVMNRLSLYILNPHLDQKLLKIGTCIRIGEIEIEMKYNFWTTYT